MEYSTQSPPPTLQLKRRRVYEEAPCVPELGADGLLVRLLIAGCGGGGGGGRLTRALRLQAQGLTTYHMDLITIQIL